MSASDNVRRSTAVVLERMRAKEAPHVVLDEEQLRAEIKAHPDKYSPNVLPPSWDQHYHFSDGTDLTAQYVLVLDGLNFCFWPLPEYEYAELAGSLKCALEKDNEAFSAKNLMKLEESTLEQWLQPPPFSKLAKQEGKDGVKVQIPLLQERTLLLREIGRVLDERYEGLAANLIRAAKGSAAKLVDLVTEAFPGFRDHSIYQGHQVHYYKRAQIFVGDVWGAFSGRGLGEFNDIDRLTTFADYRLPQLLRTLGIFKYSPALLKAIDEKTEIPAGSEQELEIRAATVQAVELMVKELAQQGVKINSVQLDWILWERGESLLAELPPHHRTLTIYY